MLGIEDSIPFGPLSVRVHVRLGADGVDEECPREIVEWVEAYPR